MRLKGGKQNKETIDYIIFRLKKLNFKYSYRIKLKVSSTGSIYGSVIFYKRQDLFLFAIKDHNSNPNGIPNVFHYNDFNTVEALVNRIKNSVNEAYYKNKRVSKTDLSLVEYNLLSFLRNKGLIVSVSWDSYDGVKNFQIVDKETNELYEGDKPFVSSSLLTGLYLSGLLIEMKNRPKVRHLIISDLGYLSIDIWSVQYGVDKKVAF